jgi:UDP-N-acetylglucosamine--N-acetylmuramyl-(pentapeptide) pyrophosphoryl-undecaprenol N-acetylglucosamine transferase
MSLVKRRVIISGGGTGGHIFPAIAIGKALQAADPNIELLFVGAEGRMEMERIPAAGFNIIGLPVAGFQRAAVWPNLSLPFKILKSLLKARKIIRDFKPGFAVGVGGYASGPLLQAARWVGIPYLIQEQNSFAGITNKLLAGGAKAICVAYPDMDKVFPASKIHFTGNPVRPEMTRPLPAKEQALNYFGLKPALPVVFLTGGSLGARTLNNAAIESLNGPAGREFQLIWQTGKSDFARCSPLAEGIEGVKCMAFVDRMDMAYAAADVVISRAGALAISELQLVGCPCILVPSPNVAEDHQTHNAKVLASAGAALMLKESEAEKNLFNTAWLLLNDEKRRNNMHIRLKEMAVSNAAEKIAEIIIKNYI